MPYEEPPSEFGDLTPLQKLNWHDGLGALYVQVAGDKFVFRIWPVKETLYGEGDILFGVSQDCALNIVLAYVDGDGRQVSKVQMVASAIHEDMQEAMLELGIDFFKALRDSGKKTGRCAFCSKELVGLWQHIMGFSPACAVAAGLDPHAVVEGLSLGYKQMLVSVYGSNADAVEKTHDLKSKVGELDPVDVQATCAAPTKAEPKQIAADAGKLAATCLGGAFGSATGIMVPAYAIKDFIPTNGLFAHLFGEYDEEGQDAKH